MSDYTRYSMELHGYSAGEVTAVEMEHGAWMLCARHEEIVAALTATDSAAPILKAQRLEAELAKLRDDFNELAKRSNKATLELLRVKELVDKPEWFDTPCARAIRSALEDAQRASAATGTVGEARGSAVAKR